ncbi:aldehyde dehydrogenase [Dactylosporangium sp. AC04546]|uniref:aldehyde dehydrogenase n=1 Tax=Dactylosporangium sp. AC04546 TaxID=2862460 RepID=UPI001EDF6E2D|nr:aldehyde dehydrogenase [Dactylosporangium sp. AC04546]WVK86909.1 aldehyde dehydrogenase [Dactylosporangium sp. AC04546]
MITHDVLFIGGRWVKPDSDTTIEVVSPSTEEVVGRVPAPSAEDVDRAVRAAREAFDHGPWPRMAAAERAAVLHRIADGLEERADELAELVTTENGTPISISRAAQVLGAIPHLRAYADLVDQYTFDETRDGVKIRAAILREPVGVVAAIVPWNGPLVLALMKLAPGLAAGCTFVCKPPPETPLAFNVLAEICERAGLPEGVLSIIAGDREVGRTLVAHPGVDKVAFTGSTAAGKWIMGECARQIKRVSLELGGKSAAIILDDVDASAAIGQMLPMATMLSGQMCLLQSRILVPRARQAELVDTFCNAVSALKVGDPFDADTYYGPLIAERQRERVEGYIAAGRQEGATLVLGGGRPKHMPTGWYVEPTVFTDVDNSMTIAREEIFGPVTSIIAYDDLDEAIAIANDTDFGLAGAVYTADPSRGFEVARRVRAGTYGVNCYGTDARVPFGGYKQSGLGREGGREGLESYLETKAVALPAGYSPFASS